LIYGASSVSWLERNNWSFSLIFFSKFKTIPVLAWLALSSYHLIDFLLMFTPIYGTPMSFNAIPLIMWGDLSKFGIRTIIN
jgi:hypothetical protein